ARHDRDIAGKLDQKNSALHASLREPLTMTVRRPDGWRDETKVPSTALVVACKFCARWAFGSVDCARMCVRNMNCESPKSNSKGARIVNTTRTQGLGFAWLLPVVMVA